MQQVNLLRDYLALRLPAAVIFQPVGHIIVGQLRFRFDGRREELNIVFDGPVSSQDHTAGQNRTNFVGAQGAEVIREFARQHRNVEARQIVGKGANFCRIVQLAAFGNQAVGSAMATVRCSLPSAASSAYSASSISSVLALSMVTKSAPLNRGVPDPHQASRSLPHSALLFPDYGAPG